MFKTPTGKKAIYYHTNWAGYGRNFQVKDIPEDVVDISYAFFDLKQDGSISSTDSWADTDKRYTGNDGVPPADSWNDNNGMYGNFGQFKKLKDAGRKLNITLSIGGWTLSKNFSPAISTQINRTNFVNNIINMFSKWKIFNGVSLDWEYPSDDNVNYGLGGNLTSKDDSENFVLFLMQLRKALNESNMKTYSVAMCCVADPNKAKFNVEKIHPYLDELHIMTYDFHDGNWGETKTCHHTNPRKSSHGTFSCEEAADYYISRGVPSYKCYIGVAFYSRGFSRTDGLGKTATGGSTDMSWEPGSVDYKVLPLPGAVEYFDQEAKAAYSYDPLKRVFNSYDNVESVKEKCKIVFEKKLGGILIWSSDADAKGSRSLISTMKNHLTHTVPSVPSVPSVPAVPSVPSVPSVPKPVISVPVKIPAKSECICEKFKSIKLSLDIEINTGSVKNTRVEYIKK